MFRFSIIALLLAGSISCGSRTPRVEPPAPELPPGAPPAAPPAAPPPALTEVVRLGPSALRYVSHQVVHVEIESQGSRQPMDFALRSFFRVNIVGPADDAGYQTTITVDSVVPDSGSTIPPGLNPAGMRGASVTGRLSPIGRLTIAPSSDTSRSEALNRVISSFENFFPRLPAAGATVGAAWTDTTNTADRTMSSVSVRTVNNARAIGWEQRNNARSLRVDVISDYTIQGSAEQFGERFDVSGSGQRIGSDYIAVDGRYLGSEARDSTSMTISVPTRSQTIRRMQVSRSTVTVLP
jgi:hypothetical protein